MKKSHQLPKRPAILLIILNVPGPGIKDHPYMKKKYTYYEHDP
jgi:hypothetical protein